MRSAGRRLHDSNFCHFNHQRHLNAQKNVFPGIHSRLLQGDFRLLVIRHSLQGTTASECSKETFNKTRVDPDIEYSVQTLTYNKQAAIEL
jgi:hypothetical protein